MKWWEFAVYCWATNMALICIGLVGGMLWYSYQEKREDKS